MPGCAAIGCNNRSEKGYAMKCFPRDPLLRELWTEKVGRADWIPSNNSFLCHEHFDVDQWIPSQSGRVKLKRHAVPSIFEITSTRKSPRKRRKLTNVECSPDIDFVEYLDDDFGYTALITAHNTYRNQLAAKFGFNLLSPNVMHNENQQPETIVIPDDNNQTIDKAKTNMEINVHTDPDIDDIERNLRLICEGESQSDQKSNTEIISSNTNGKNFSSVANVDDKTNARLNGNLNDDKANNSTSRKRRSRYETIRDTENNGDVKKSLNGINVKEETNEQTSVDPAASRESMFTIKVTGIDEDVTEIVKSLGTEPILRYRSSKESTRNRNCLVTSVYSVVDRLVSSNSDDLVVPKVEENSFTDATKIWGFKKTQYLKKLASESSFDNENLTNVKQLQKKIQIQEKEIYTLTKQLEEFNDVSKTMNKSNSRIDPRISHLKRTTCDGKIGKDYLVKDLSERLLQMDDVNKNLEKNLTEKNQQMKKLEWQLRKRDNSIKELNWKLQKASKYLDKAEKNTNTYRKKMMSMQSMLNKQTIAAEPNNSKNFQSTTQEKSQILVDVKKETIDEYELYSHPSNEIYETVQDIFDESNDCDDDLSVIDTREDFLREFKCAL